MDMTEEELHARGINDSILHMDFMIGSDDLHIVGIREDGSETDIFVNGTWAEWLLPAEMDEAVFWLNYNSRQQSKEKLVTLLPVFCIIDNKKVW